MKLDDFRCMRHGRHISTVSPTEAIWMKPITQKNGKNRRVLLMFHGFASTPAVFRQMLPHLDYYGAIVAPALPGHAVSLDDFARMQASSFLPFVEGIYTSLLQEFEQVDVLGLSTGGLLACYLGQRYPLHHLYLLAPATDLHLAINKTITLAHFLQKIGFRCIRNMAGNLYTSRSFDIAFQKLPLNTLIELLNFIKSFQLAIPSCPIDLFLGEHDEVVSTRCVAMRFEGSKNTRIHWLKQSAHLLPLDGDVHTILQCMAENNQDLIHAGK